MRSKRSGRLAQPSRGSRIQTMSFGNTPGVHYAGATRGDRAAEMVCGGATKRKPSSPAEEIRVGAIATPTHCDRVLSPLLSLDRAAGLGL